MCWSTVVEIIKFLVFFPWSLMQLFRRTHLSYAEGGPLDVDSKPFTTEKMAKELVYSLYGMKVTQLKKMNGYDDENYHVQVSAEHSNPHLTELNRDGYTLKIMNAEDSKDKNFVNGMHQVIKHVRSKGIYVPEPIPNVSGDLWSMEEIPMKGQQLTDEDYEKRFPDQKKCVVRMFTFLPGTTIHSVPLKYSDKVSFQWGKLLARFHNSLEEFQSPLLEHRQCPWSLMNVMKVDNLLHVLNDPFRMHITMAVLKAFHQINSKLKQLPHVVIHGDFNEQNVIVLEKPPEGRTKDPNYVVYGVLDFGDVHRAPIVCDVAVMLAYAVINSCDLMVPTLAAGHALAGYLSLRHLSNDELSLLRVCTAARMVQSLILGANAHIQDPENDYILTTSKKGWSCLERLWNMPKMILYDHWRHVIGTYGSIDHKNLKFEADTSLKHV